VTSGVPQPLLEWCYKGAIALSGAVQHEATFASVMAVTIVK